MSAQGDFAPFLKMDHLSVMVAQPAYLLAMKCLAMRIGAEFHDEDDIRYLLRHLDVRTYNAGDLAHRQVLSTGAIPAEDSLRAGGAAAGRALNFCRRASAWVNSMPVNDRRGRKGK